MERVERFRKLTNYLKKILDSAEKYIFSKKYYRKCFEEAIYNEDFPSALYFAEKGHLNRYYYEFGFKTAMITRNFQYALDFAEKGHLERNNIYLAKVFLGDSNVIASLDEITLSKKKKIPIYITYF
ncbi:MAG: hypothetical protein DRP10_04405 [Candidatus Aenigmatarchaeota archaeon]|nr:MAG: hypothetical protein DRP10_04405 [Candidatus Aenigmarchaeota archaeon]